MNGEGGRICFHDKEYPFHHKMNQMPQKKIVNIRTKGGKHVKIRLVI